MLDKIIQSLELEKLLVELFEASKVSKKNAISVAQAIVKAELVGQIGHGLRRLKFYLAGARSGKIDGFANPSFEKKSSSVIHIDAASGFAYPAIDLALKILPPLTFAQGIAMAGIYHSHHSGVMGNTVEKLAEQGIVSFFFANSPSAVASWNSNEPIFGTNPIAFGAPLEDAAPIVVDMSLTKVARGKIIAASQKNTPIPKGWALDNQGNATTDPHKALQGTLLPFGEQKGIALILMVELLTSAFIGANFSSNVSSFFDDKGTFSHSGQLMIAMDAKIFSKNALSDFGKLAKKIEEKARIPGSRRQKLAQKFSQTGIRIPEDLWQQILEEKKRLCC